MKDNQYAASVAEFKRQNAARFSVRSAIDPDFARSYKDACEAVETLAKYNKYDIRLIDAGRADHPVMGYQQHTWILEHPEMGMIATIRAFPTRMLHEDITLHIQGRNIADTRAIVTFIFDFARLLANMEIMSAGFDTE